jgi:hypothetical protein
VGRRPANQSLLHRFEQDLQSPGEANPLDGSARRLPFRPANTLPDLTHPPFEVARAAGQRRLAAPEASGAGAVIWVASA